MSEDDGQTWDTEYSIGLVAGGVEVGTFETLSSPANGTPVDMVYTLDTSLDATGVGNDLQIRIRAKNVSAGFTQANFDNVRLDVAAVAIPEPSSIFLAVSAVCFAGIAIIRRRRR